SMGAAVAASDVIASSAVEKQMSSRFIMQQLSCERKLVVAKLQKNHYSAASCLSISVEAGEADACGLARCY
ncbi:MAG: hypothetical protein PUI19_09325, partial [Sodaliphilus pleomorphus]|uniref:hypothetical protein n=1 Tax=Sodaliphilus pleomorphus TaxID=2606626 RepID=UPI0023F5533D